jgi:hypothetical protein
MGKKIEVGLLVFEAIDSEYLGRDVMVWGFSCGRKEENNKRTEGRKHDKPP